MRPPDWPSGIHAWGSFCVDGDSGTGTLTTSPFRAPRALVVYLAGYTSNHKISLEVERISDGSKFAVLPPSDPREKWIRYAFSIPAAWRGSLIRLIAHDEATGPGGWFAFTEPIEPGDSGFTSAAALLGGTMSHFLLILLPGIAVCMFGVNKGAGKSITAGLVLLATVGVVGYLIFWLYFFSPRIGHATAFLLPVMALLLSIWLAPRLGAPAREVLKPLIPPLLLVGASAILVLSAGFLYGGLNAPLRTASVRFSHPLPPDNGLPFVFAEALRDGQVPHPLVMDWLSSDRPPLQTGIVLSQYPFALPPRERSYTEISVLAQCLWLFAMWLFLRSLAVPPSITALTLLTSFFSGFVFLNSFYVWPKLLAAAFTLGFGAVMLDRGLDFRSYDGKLRCLAGGALLALGMLSHGGTVFAAIGLMLGIFIVRRRVPVRGVAVIIAVAGAVYLPWSLYQKFVDPPGDRLLKMHLAGVLQSDSRPFTEVLISSYEHLSPQKLLENKVANADAILGHSAYYWGEFRRVIQSALAGDGASALHHAEQARISAFFYFVPSLGFLTLGFLALGAGARKRFRTAEWRISALVSIVVVFSLIAWAVLMFGPGTTIVHQGAYAINLLALAACVLALSAISPTFAAAICALQIAMNVLLYFVYMRGIVPGRPLPEGYLLPGMLALCILALAVVLYLFRVLARDPGLTRACSIRGTYRAAVSVEGP